MKMVDSKTWKIIAGDEDAFFIVSHLTQAMQLMPAQKGERRLIVLTDNHRTGSGSDDTLFERNILFSKRGGSVNCILKSTDDCDILAQQLRQLAQVFCLQAQTYGGMLLHGALAEREGDGVILAGPWGIGKTTASQRLAPPWRSLCDDLTLVVCDQQGVYWAHPWPTWSRFRFGGGGGSWNVQHRVLLRSIFFLGRENEDRIESVGTGQAACLLVESAEQAWDDMLWSTGDHNEQTVRLQRFNNICALAQVVPCYLLHLSLTGKFWQEIEKVLAFEDKT